MSRKSEGVSEVTDPQKYGDQRAMLAICDALVLKALETLGKRIVRQDRSRYRNVQDRNFIEAYSQWPVHPVTLEKSLTGAWDLLPILLQHHVPEKGDIQALEVFLDRYVRETVLKNKKHSLGRLYREFEVLS